MIAATLQRCCSDVLRLLATPGRKGTNEEGFSETIHLRHLAAGHIPVALAFFPVLLTRLQVDPILLSLSVLHCVYNLCSCWVRRCRVGEKMGLTFAIPSAAACTTTRRSSSSMPERASIRISWTLSGPILDSDRSPREIRLGRRFAYLPIL